MRETVGIPFLSGYEGQFLPLFNNNDVMLSTDPLTISLTSALRRFIDDQVASGRYLTTSEVVRASQRLLTTVDPPRSIDKGGRLINEMPKHV